MVKVEDMKIKIWILDDVRKEYVKVIELESFSWEYIFIDNFRWKYIFINKNRWG